MHTSQVFFWSIESEEWLSQLIFQFEQLERRSLKKIRASTYGIRTRDLRDTGVMLYMHIYELIIINE